MRSLGMKVLGIYLAVIIQNFPLHLISGKVVFTAKSAKSAKRGKYPSFALFALFALFAVNPLSKMHSVSEPAAKLLSYPETLAIIAP